MMKNLKYICLWLLCGLALSAPAQQREVKVTTNSGSVFEGKLQEFKVFQYVMLEMGGGRLIKLDYKDIAYIDDLNPVKAPEPAPEPTVVLEVVPTPAPEPAVVPTPAPEPAVVPKPEPELAPETVPAPAPVVQSKWSDYHGFLLESGNNVYFDCTSDPKNDQFNEAALDVLKRHDGFWKIVDRPEDAHFSIVCVASLHEKSKVSIGISSKITGKEEVFGEVKAPEDVNEYRKVVWELYNKHIIPLQKKIETNKTPKRIAKDFTK